MSNEFNRNEVDQDEALDFEWWEPTEEMIRENYQQHLRELAEKKQNTMVFDAGSGKKVKLKEFEKFYGTNEFSKELLNATRKRIPYSKETAGKLKRMYAELTQSKIIPIGKAKSIQEPNKQVRTKKAKRNQFIPMEYCFVDKVKNAECHHNPTALLMILLKHRTWPKKMDKHHTYTYWYQQKELIVASRSIKSLAEELGTCERTVRTYLKQLENNGDIEIVKGEKFGSRRENVYILGEVDENGNEILFHSMQK